MAGHVQVKDVSAETKYEIRVVKEDVQFPSQYTVVLASDVKEALKSAEVEYEAIKLAGKAGLSRPSLSAMLRPTYATDKDGNFTNVGGNVREYRREFVIYGDV
jgi:hypothetical protein